MQQVKLQPPLVWTIEGYTSEWRVRGATTHAPGTQIPVKGQSSAVTGAYSPVEYTTKAVRAGDTETSLILEEARLIALAPDTRSLRGLRTGSGILYFSGGRNSNMN